MPVADLGAEALAGACGRRRCRQPGFIRRSIGRAGARRGPRKEVVLTGVSSASSRLTTCATTDDGCGQRRSLQTNLGVCQALGETILDAFCAPQLQTSRVTGPRTRGTRIAELRGPVNSDADPVPEGGDRARTGDDAVIERQSSKACLRARLDPRRKRKAYEPLSLLGCETPLLDWCREPRFASRLGGAPRLDCDPHPLRLRISSWNGGVPGFHMTDFQTEEWSSAALSAPGDPGRLLAPHIGTTALHRAWLRVTTGAGLIAIAVSVSAIVSVLLAWTFFSGLLYRDRTEASRAVLQRIFELTALQTGPQSALGCLDVSPGDALEQTCERRIFASAETVAGANAFVAARLSVLGDAVATSNGVHSYATGVVAALRQALENDSFGIVAHVLAARYGCSASQCSVFALLNDTSKVIANLNARTFENLVARYAPSWQGGGGISALPGSSPAAAATALSPLSSLTFPVTPPAPQANLRASSGGGPLKGLYVPPASSIPAVSIMTEEPRTPPTTANAPSTAPGSAQHAPAPAHSSPRAPPPAPPIQLSPDPPNPG